MVTNDERRAVAARIRELRKHAWDESSVFDLLGCAVEECGLDDTDQLFARLADLIEPGPQCPYYSDERHWCGIYDIETERTCHIVMVSPGEWECSACGGGIDWDSYDEGDLPNCNYCPNCGAKVVDE